MDMDMDFDNFEEKLIALVKEHDFLYNTKSRKYKNSVNRESAWAKIGAQLHRPGEECKQRWKSLRDRFVREKKKLEQPSGSGAKATQPWELYPQMDFLNQAMQPRKQTGNHEQTYDESSGAQDVFSPVQEDLDDPQTPTIVTRQNKTSRPSEFPINEFFGNLSQTFSTRFNTAAPDLDDNDMFMNMISKKMKILPEESKIRLQGTILKDVNDEILKFLKENENKN